MIPRRWIKKLFKRRSSNSSFENAWYQKVSAAFERYLRKSWTNLGKLTARAAKLRRFYVPPARPNGIHLLNPAFWIVWVFRFFYYWSSSRPTRDWLISLPALATVTLIIAGLINSIYRPKSSRVEQYRNLFSMAVAKSDFARAQIAINVLRDLQPNDIAIQFSSALVDYDLGDTRQAIDHISLLVDKFSYPEAAIWLLDHDFNIDDAESWSKVQAGQFERYAELALNYEGTSSKAHNYLGRYFKEIGEFSTALKHFEKLLSVDPEYSFVTAELYKNLGDEYRATTLARKFERFFADRSKRSPNNVSYRIKLAQLLIFQEREEAASQLLLDGFNYSQGQVQEYRLGAGEALVAKIERLNSGVFSPARFIQQVQLVKSALVFSSDSKLVQRSTNTLLKQILEDKNSEQEYLRRALVSGQYPDAIHLMMGLVGVLTNDGNMMDLHLSVAMQASTDLSTILASLAQYWCESTEWQVAANTLIEFAYERDRRPLVLGVRGLIHEKQGQDELAIQDLEAAIKFLESSFLYEALARSYQKAGRPDLSRQAQFRADSIRSKNSTTGTLMSNER